MDSDTKADSASDDFKFEPSKHAWATSNGRFWVPTPTAERLPAGVYSVGSSQRLGPYLDLAKIVKDDLVVLPDMGAEVVLHEIKQFMAKKDAYRARKIVHKRGIIMEGPPGSGKTSNSELLIELFVSQMDGIVLFGNDAASCIVGLGLVRAREADRPIMVVIEDIDAVIRGHEEAILNLLDGKHQHDGVVIVATTNHLEKLPDRIANRPSRFDLVIKVGPPSEAARRAYLKHVEPDMTDADIEWIVGLTNEYSVAHLKELLILTQVYGMPIDAAAARIDAIMKRKLLPEQASLKVVADNKPFGVHDKAA